MQRNILSYWLQKIDTRSQIAKWKKIAEEVIIIDSASLLWVPPEKDVKKIIPNYKIVPQKNIIVAKKQLVYEHDKLLALPDFACSIPTLEFFEIPTSSISKIEKFESPKVSAFSQKPNKINTIWIGDQKQQKTPKTLNVPPVTPKKSENEDNIKTLVMFPSDEKQKEIDAINELDPAVLREMEAIWLPQAKHADLFVDELINAKYSSSASDTSERKVQKYIDKRYPDKASTAPEKKVQKYIDKRYPDNPRLTTESKIHEDFKYRFNQIYLRSNIGTIYTATHATNNVKFLALCIHDDFAFSPHYRSNMEKLSHEYILSIKDIHRTTIVYENKKITPLKLYIKQNGVSLQQKLELLQHVIIAMEYSYRHKVVHGNLNMNTIGVDSQGLPKIFGFGLKKYTQNITRVSFRRDIQKDITAIGYVLFELITGKSALRRETVTKLQRRSDLQKLLLPTHLRKNLPIELQQMCIKAIDTRAEYKYNTLEEIKTDINLFLENKYEKNYGSYLFYKANTWWGQHRDRMNVYIIGIFIFLSLWLLPASLPDFLDPTAKSEEAVIAELINDLKGNNKADCVLAMKKLGTMGDKAFAAIPYLQELLGDDAKIVSDTAKKTIKSINPNIIIANNESNTNKDKLNNSNTININNIEWERDKNKVTLLLQDFKIENRVLALSILENIDASLLDVSILELLIVNMNYSYGKVSELATKIMEKAIVTEENIYVFRNAYSDNNYLLRRMALRKLSSAQKEVVQNDETITVFISSLNDKDSYNNTLGINFLRNCNLIENKWIPEIVTKLRNVDIQIRNDIYNILGKITPIEPQRSSYLIGLLSDRNRHVQTYAQQALSQIEVSLPETTYYLMEAFQGNTSYNKEWFLRGLSDIQFKSEYMVPVLQEAAKDNNSSVRRWSAVCMGRMKDFRMMLIPELENLISDSNDSVKKAAESALEKIR